MTRLTSLLLKVRKKTGLILSIQFVFILASASSTKLNGIKGFKLNSCKNEKCIFITSKKAYFGHYANNNYAFDKVKFQMKEKNTNKEMISFEAKDVYLDFVIKRVLFRDVQDMKFKQAIYNFEEGRLIKL